MSVFTALPDDIGIGLQDFQSELPRFFPILDPVNNDDTTVTATEFVYLINRVIREFMHEMRTDLIANGDTSVVPTTNEKNIYWIMKNGNFVFDQATGKIRFDFCAVDLQSDWSYLEI